MSTQSHNHEKKDVDVASMFLVALILFLSGALISFAMLGLMRFLTLKQQRREAAAPAPVESATPFPQPRLQAQSGADLQKLRAAEDERLNSYGWINRRTGIAHIPIDRAMQMTLERGLPDVGGNQTPLQFMQARPQQNEMPQPGGHE